MDRYFLRELAGAGGMADVYQAWDTLRSTRMAIKVLRPSKSGKQSYSRMFAQEAEVLRKLEHPNIVRLYEYEKDKENNVVFIVMDWIDGSNLREEIVQRNQPLSIHEVAAIMTPICSALHFAHQNNVFHCDVKPANILIQEDGRVFLTDFGVARLKSSQNEGGTPQYMAPEQLAGKDVDARTDVFGLGIVIYEMLSAGKLPYRGDSPNSQGSTTRERIYWEHTHLPLPSLRELNPELPESLEGIVFKALCQSPDQRYLSVIDLRNEIDQASQQMPRLPIKKETLLDRLAPMSRQAGIQLRQTLESFSLPEPPTPKQPKYIIRASQSENPPVKKPKNAHVPSQSLGSIGPRLICIRGSWQGQQLSFPKGKTSIGRSNQNHIVIPDKTISRIHATLIGTKRGYYIRDEGSTAGTYVNGQRIYGPMKLKSGDQIQIGYHQIFEFQEY